jgi:two-component system, cell cycle response regulator DivK
MPTPKCTILIVEDTEDIRLLVKLMLEQKGFRVLEAADGKEAVELALEHKPDLIFMDLRMPVVDGFEATRRLRQLPETRKIPIVGLSAHCEDGWHKRAIEAGCDDCIMKPIEDRMLTEILSRFL